MATAQGSPSHFSICLQAAAFCAAQFLTSYPWGWISERVGRKVRDHKLPACACTHMRAGHCRPASVLWIVSQLPPCSFFSASCKHAVLFLIMLWGKLSCPAACWQCAEPATLPAAARGHCQQYQQPGVGGCFRHEHQLCTGSGCQADGWNLQLHLWVSLSCAHSIQGATLPPSCSTPCGKRACFVAFLGTQHTLCLECSLGHHGHTAVLYMLGRAAHHKRRAWWGHHTYVAHLECRGLLGAQWAHSMKHRHDILLCSDISLCCKQVCQVDDWGELYFQGTGQGAGPAEHSLGCWRCHG